MSHTKTSWMELVGALVLLGGSSAMVLAQGGGPPPVPKCYSCQPSPDRCGTATISADACCCCFDGFHNVWACKAATNDFICADPPWPWSGCFQVL